LSEFESKSESKSKEQLQQEVKQLRARVAELEALEELHKQASAKQRLLATVVADSNVAVTVQSRDGTITEWNAGAKRMYGYSEAEALGMNITVLVPEPLKQETLDLLETIARGELVESLETQRLTKDGRTLDVWLTVTVLLDDDGGVDSFATIEHDITERKQVERESAERWTSLIKNSNDHFVVVDKDYKILFINRVLPGDTVEMVIGTSAFDHVHQESIDVSRAVFDSVFKTGLPGSFEAVVEKPETGKLWLGTKVIPIKKDEEVSSVIAIATDITERKQAEDGLRKILYSLQQAEAISSLGHFERNWQTGEGHWSDGFHKLLGIEIGDVECNHLEFMKFVHPEDREKVNEYIRSSLVTPEPRDGLFRVIQKDGTLLDLHSLTRTVFDEKDRPISTVGIFMDITERKRAEEERLLLETKVLQAQKLESLGVLAGGIAHDFNNLLVGVLGNAGIALMDLSPEAPARESIRDIEVAAKRAADLAKQMLAYSGRGKFVIKHLNLQNLVEEMTHLLEISISKKVVVRFDFASDVPFIEADVTQLRQTIMNLVINASEAIGDDTGVISIRTGVMECDRSYLGETYLDDDLSEGEYAYLEISDSGCGMDEVTINRIFEPFFSSKFTGRGLGLAAVLGIVRGHQGALEVSSEPGQGTTFKVLFPVVKGPVLLDEATATEWADESLEGKAMLLVDDEETIRSVGRKMLERFGIEVVTAEDGRQALEIFSTEPKRFDCVLLDLTMPQMDGEEALREMQRVNQDVCVVLSSGYSEQELINRFAGKGLGGFIQKPYRPETLRRVLLAALGSQREKCG
jgi:PAS domain S-box-containing protein